MSIVMNDLFRRTFLAAAGSAATLPAAALAAPDRALADPVRLSDAEFRLLFEESERLYLMDYAGVGEAETERCLQRDHDMCDYIVSLTATSELQFAIQYFVSIDGGDSCPAGLFDQKMFALLGRVRRPRQVPPQLHGGASPC